MFATRPQKTLALPLAVASVAAFWLLAEPASSKALHQANPGVSNGSISCSQEFQLPRQDFWGGTGSRGLLSVNGRTFPGWVLFDTGASYIRVLPPKDYTGISDSTEQYSVHLSFGTWNADSDARYSPFLLGMMGPSRTDMCFGVKGTQVATVGSVLMSRWAVRFTDAVIYFSTDTHACSEGELRSQGFQEMDSRGFYQRAGSPADVQAAKPLDLTIPTVQATIMGETVPVQIDSGYQTPDLQVQVNDKLFARLKSKLGQSNKTAPINGTDMPLYTPPNASIEFADSRTHAVLSTIQGISIVQKPKTGGGISDWGVPAGMISGRVFTKAFGDVEFRADQHRVWARPYNQGP